MYDVKVTLFYKVSNCEFVSMSHTFFCMCLHSRLSASASIDMSLRLLFMSHSYVILLPYNLQSCRVHLFLKKQLFMSLSKLPLTILVVFHHHGCNALKISRFSHVKWETVFMSKIHLRVLMKKIVCFVLHSLPFSILRVSSPTFILLLTSCGTVRGQRCKCFTHLVSLPFFWQTYVNLSWQQTGNHWGRDHTR